MNEPSVEQTRRDIDAWISAVEKTVNELYQEIRLLKESDGSNQRTE